MMKAHEAKKPAKKIQHEATDKPVTPAEKTQHKASSKKDK